MNKIMSFPPHTQAGRAFKNNISVIRLACNRRLKQQSVVWVSAMRKKSLESGFGTAPTHLTDMSDQD